MRYDAGGLVSGSMFDEAWLRLAGFQEFKIRRVKDRASALSAISPIS